MKYRQFCGTKRRTHYKGKYTALYYERCAEIARRRTDNFLSNKFVDWIKKVTAPLEIGVL